MIIKRLIIGLGNPGPEYAGTYHSVGRLFVEYLADGGTFEAAKQDFSYVRRDEVMLAKTEVFMNQSGEAVRRIVDYWDVPLDRVIVAQDDSDLSLGQYKLSAGRGAAGHHGAESVIAALGTDGFSRLRIGIRPREEERRAKAGEFVLKNISPGDHEILYHLFAELKEKLMPKE